MVKDKCLKKILEIQNSNEYYEFVKQLQTLSAFPTTRENEEGIFIVRKISTGCRKMKLGLAYNKEQNGGNLACYTIDNTNNLVRAVTPDGSRYNVLDHEGVTVGFVSLLKANIGIHTFYLTVFPIQVDITRKILKNPTWVPEITYTGKTVTSLTSSSTNPDNANVNINIVTTVGNGIGSGIGLTKLISQSSNSAKPVTYDPIIKQYSLQIPQNASATINITPIPLNSYYVFQSIMIGNQRNLWPLTLTGNKTLMDLDLPIVSALI